ncbi:hypothetical protein B566_EDAN010614 [Ephemera danica]|nr:hypothetical protein B566_EDAN010614 [Ephemera danica]
MLSNLPPQKRDSYLAISTNGRWAAACSGKSATAARNKWAQNSKCDKLAAEDHLTRILDLLIHGRLSDPCADHHHSPVQAVHQINQIITVITQTHSPECPLRGRRYQATVHCPGRPGPADSQSATARRTSEETERRGRQVEVLESREIQLQQRFDDRPGFASSSGPSSRSRLFIEPHMSSRLPDSDDEPLGTQNVTVAEVRTQMRQIEQEQDAGLDALSKVISRQKQIAETIGGEVDIQNGYWLVIILLLIAIIVIWCV